MSVPVPLRPCCSSLPSDRRGLTFQRDKNTIDPPSTDSITVANLFVCKCPPSKWQSWCAIISKLSSPRLILLPLSNRKMHLLVLAYKRQGAETIKTVKSRKRKKKKNGRKFWRLIKMYAGTRGAEAAAENPLKTRHCKTKQKKALTVQQHADKQEREAEKR